MSRDPLGPGGRREPTDRKRVGMSAGEDFASRLLDGNLAWRFILAEAIGSSPLVPLSGGFLAVRRPGSAPPTAGTLQDETGMRLRRRRDEES